MPAFDDAFRAADDLIRRLGGSKPIRAYHGSPHSFSRFDSSKIGTGEGAQMYGHGMYFAGNEDVAKAYRDALAQRYVVGPGGERLPMPEWITDDKLAKDGVRHYRDRVKQLIAGRQAAGLPLTDLPDDLRSMEALAGGGELRRNSHMYEVEIGHPENELLDWDANFVNQSPPVQSALRNLGVTDDDMFSSGKGLVRAVYESINPLKLEPSDKNVSVLLRQQGIPGLRYLDQGSRSAGEGTRNYVMFPGTEDSIRILRKYGMLGPAAAGALSQGDQP